MVIVSHCFKYVSTVSKFFFLLILSQQEKAGKTIRKEAFCRPL